MLVTQSAEITVPNTPAEVMAVIHDVEAVPSWSSVHNWSEVVSRYDDGRPRRIRSKVTTMGISDIQTVEYFYEGENVAGWELVESTMQRSQRGVYTLTEIADGGTRVHFEFAVELKAPLPAFVVKKSTKAIMTTATRDLAAQL